MAIEEKPSRNEDEYFARQDAELMKAKRAQLDAERAKAAATAKMKCPKDGSDLKERVFHNVKIDECTQCRGVWLDPGELEILAIGDKNPVSRVFGDLIKGLR